MPRYYTAEDALAFRRIVREDRERDPEAHRRTLAEVAAQARDLYDRDDEEQADD